MRYPFFYRISENLPLLMDKFLLRRLVLFVFCFVFSLNFYAQEQQTIFVTGDVQIVGLDENIKIVNYNKDEPAKPVVSKKSVASKKTFVNKKANPKQNIIKIKQKPSEFIANTNSDQHILCNSGSDHSVSTTNPNPTIKTKLTFHYRELNIPIFTHLEKIYFEEISLSTEFSKFFFSRPPPFFS